MKKVFLAIGCLISCCSVYGQLVVQKNGNVLVGATPNVTALSKLTVGALSESNYYAYFSPINANGIMVRNADGKTGLTIDNSAQKLKGYTGLYISPGGASSNYIPTCGMLCYSGISNEYNYGVVGAVFSSVPSNPKASAGIYGSSTTSRSFAYPGIYAGYFNGDVRVTGSLYGTLLTPSASSVVSSKLSTVSYISIPVSEENVSGKLQQVSLLRILDNEKDLQNKKTLSISSELFNDSAYRKQLFEDLRDGYDCPAVQTQKAAVRYGLAADQLREIYPELVYEDAEGNLSINYIEMIPLLVESIKELTSKVVYLEKSAARVNLAKSRDTVTGISDMSDTDLLSLSQNRPNPFGDKTYISINVPNTVKAASLFIYDMNGKQIKQISITDRGNVSVHITAEEFDSGMYLYSLIADGKIVDTKRMVVTK